MNRNCQVYFHKKITLEMAMITLRLVAILCSILLIYCGEVAFDSLRKIHEAISSEYDRKHPPYNSSTRLKPHFHSKRCIMQQIEHIIRKYDDWVEFMHGYHILVHSACLGK